MLAMLSYFIRGEMLTGLVDGKTFATHAVSGFGRGWQRSTDEPPDVPRGQAALNYVAKESWGPIPPGFYKVRRPEQVGRGRFARIDSHLGPPAYGRHDFEIHGRAPHEHHGQFHTHASHGCIVPTDPAQFNNLLDSLATVAPGHTHVATLRVFE